MAAKFSSGLDRKPLLAVDSVDPEVAPVRRQDELSLELLGEDDERRVREIHRQVSIGVHQVATSPKGRGRRGNEHRATFEEEAATRLRAALDAAEQVRCLRQHGFGADDRTFPSFEEAGERLVPGLASIEQRDQTAGVEEQLTGHVSTTRRRRRDGAPPGAAIPIPGGRADYERGTPGSTRSWVFLREKR